MRSDEVGEEGLGLGSLTGRLGIWSNFFRKTRKPFFRRKMTETETVKDCQTKQHYCQILPNNIIDCLSLSNNLNCQITLSNNIIYANSIRICLANSIRTCLAGCHKNKKQVSETDKPRQIPKNSLRFFLFLFPQRT
jgi:hypothetical protein